MKYLGLLLLTASCATGGGPPVHEPDAAPSPAPLFAHGTFAAVQSARIYTFRRNDDGTVAKLEICRVSSAQGIRKLTFILSRLSGYRVANGIGEDEWQRSVELDTGQVILISNDEVMRYPTVVIGSEGKQFALNNNTESHIHVFFDCIGSF